LSFLGIWSCVQAMLLIAASVALFLIGVSLPAGEQRVQTLTMRFDEFLLGYQFGEVHSIRIQALCERVYVAIQQVIVDEISFFHMLTWIRRFGQLGPESILNPLPNEPILILALRTSFMKLAEEPKREIVLGTLVAALKGTQLKKDPIPEDFKAFQAPYAP